MNNNQFAFIVHARFRKDLIILYKVLKFLPNFIVDLVSRYHPPVVISNVYEDKNKIGIIIGIPMTAKQLLERKDIALEKILYSIEIAKKKGIKTVGLGAMTSSLSKGGKDVEHKYPEIKIVNGINYTVINIIKYINKIVSVLQLDISHTNISVVGASGGIGFGVTRELFNIGFRNINLIDVDRKINILKNKLSENNISMNKYDISITSSLETLIKSKIIIAATNSPETVIKTEHVSPGTIIINDAQPSDIDPYIEKNRSDILVVEGGIVSTEDIEVSMNLGLKNKNDIYSCMAETIIINKFQNYDVYSKKVNPEISKESDRLGFGINTLQNSSFLISNDIISQFKNSTTD